MSGLSAYLEVLEEQWPEPIPDSLRASNLLLALHLNLKTTGPRPLLRQFLTREWGLYFTNLKVKAELYKQMF
jgi:hypothetical protein